MHCRRSTYKIQTHMTVFVSYGNEETTVGDIAHSQKVTQKQFAILSLSLFALRLSLFVLPQQCSDKRVYAIDNLVIYRCNHGAVAVRQGVLSVMNVCARNNYDDGRERETEGKLIIIIQIENNK